MTFSSALFYTIQRRLIMSIALLIRIHIQEPIRWDRSLCARANISGYAVQRQAIQNHTSNGDAWTAKQLRWAHGKVSYKYVRHHISHITVYRYRVVVPTMEIKKICWTCNSDDMFACHACGGDHHHHHNNSPYPLIIWIAASSIPGHTLNITSINRVHMGAYQCLADNGVPVAANATFYIEVHCELAFVHSTLYVCICTYVLICIRYWFRYNLGWAAIIYNPRWISIFINSGIHSVIAFIGCHGLRIISVLKQICVATTKTTKHWVSRTRIHVICWCNYSVTDWMWAYQYHDYFPIQYKRMFFCIFRDLFYGWDQRMCF